jgi:hypothetical protein
LNLTSRIDMGQAIGKFHGNMDRFWLSAQKFSDWEQHLSTGIDEISLDSKGRLGGQLVLKKLQVRTAIMWDKEAESFTVPLVQVVAGFGSLGARASLDYHTFAIVCIKRVYFGMSNERGGEHVLGDRLLVAGDCESVSVLLTVLAASNMLDIVYTVQRMRSASLASYKAILQDSSTGGAEDHPREQQKKIDEALSNIFTKLRTVFDMRINAFNLFIFPNSFADSTVFSANIHQANAMYISELKGGVLESSLELKMSRVFVALATMKKSYNGEISLIVPGEFLSFVSESARGGTIIHVPLFVVTMKTWQELGKFVIEYTFNSSFGGRVDIGWNLGSVNVIREMWENHARAFTARRESYSMYGAKAKAISGMTLDENLKEATLNSRYTYVAREPPNVATPQLRDMGEATPPIEWIGLHRQRFPWITHQFVIVGLQSLVHEIGMYRGNLFAFV